MAYDTIQDVIDDITLRIIPNNNKEIQGQELQDILVGICSFISPSLQEQLIVNLGIGQSVGGADNGEAFVQGRTLESIFRDILIKAVHPTYTGPSLVLSTDVSTFDLESGTIISPTFNSVFTQNDAGSIVTRVLKRNGATISSAMPYLDTARQIVDGATVYNLSNLYNIGPVKNNNLGAPDSTGQILAGTIVSNNITYTGKRKIFGGVVSTVPTTSAEIRALSQSLLDPVIGSEFLLSIPLGAERVSFGYPASLPDVSSVQYIELGQSEIKSLFNKTLVNVEGANGYASISYKVFTYTPVEPFQTSVTFKVTI